MDIVTKKQLNVLIHLAKADKHFAQEERDLIKRIAHQRNFPEEQLNQLLDEPEPIESLGALSLGQKFEYLKNSVELIFADQKVHESEVRFSKGIALKLGFNIGVIDFLIEQRGKRTYDDLKDEVIREFF